MFEKVHKNYLSDNAIKDFYIALIECGRDRYAFYPGPRATPDEFLAKVRKDNTPWWLLYWNGQNVGYVTLRGFEGKSAFLDYAFLPSPVLRHEARIPFPVALGRFMMASILYDTYIDGTPILDTIIGKSPVWNKASINMIERLGGHILGVIPLCCECYDSHTMSDGVISYFNRDTVKQEWINY